MQNEVDEDIETALVGCYLMDYEAAATEAADFSIDKDMFASPTAKMVFEIMAKMHEQQRPIDPLTVRNQLGNYADPAWTRFLEKAIESSPTTAHTGYYAQLVRQKFETRRLRAMLGAASRKLDDEPADMVQTELMRQLERNDADPAKDGITFSEAAAQAISTFKKAAEGTAGIKTGLAFIDGAGGIQEGELIIISGKAGSCKTTLARQILTHVCSVEKIPAALITLEMSEAQIAAQTLTDQSRTSQRKFMAGVANDEDWARLFAAQADTEGWPLAITSRARTPARLAAYVRKVVRRGAKLIVLDYLQAMQPNPDMLKMNSEAQTTFASNVVRDLAVNLGIRFIVVCTENREGDLRYSDAIRYDAWKWLRMIQPEENNDDNPEFHLDMVKNRFGPVPKSIRRLYRVGNRLLTETEWIEYTKTNKGRKDPCN